MKALQKNPPNSAFLKTIVVTSVLCFAVMTKFRSPQVGKLVLNAAPASTSVLAQMPLASPALLETLFTVPPRPEVMGPPLPEGFVSPVEVVSIPAPKKHSKLARAFSRNSKSPRRQLATIKAKAPAVKKVATKQLAITAEMEALIEAGLMEAPLGDVFDQDPYLTLAVFEPVIDLGNQVTRVQPILLEEGLIARNDLSAVHATLTALAQEIPAPTLVTAKKPKQEKAAPVLVAKADSVKRAAPSQPLAVPPTTTSATEAEPAKEEGTPELVVPEVEPESEPVVAESKPEPELVVPSPAAVSAPEKAVRQNLSPVQAGIGLGSQMMTTQTPTSTSVSPVKKAAGVTTQKTPEKTSLPLPPVDPEPKKDRNRRHEGGKVYGKFSMDTAFQEWILGIGGHVELYLNRVGSRNPDDTVFIEYRYPERDFEFDLSGTEGAFKLVAGVFKPGVPTAIAEVPYEKVVSGENFKDNVVFHVRKAMLDSAMKVRTVASQKTLVLTGTVFEGATGDHRDPKPIAEAKVEVIGLSEKGLFQTDADGNFRIQGVPPQSEFLLRVSAKGFFETHTVVPTFASDTYTPVYLISKDKTDAVTRYFTKRVQSLDKGLIFGRAFHPTQRAPQAGVEFSLSGRTSRPLYYGALPNVDLRETTDSGLFSFFNVEPSFRSLSKAGVPVAALLNVRPGEAYYVEMGRSGTKSLHGRLYDPFRQSPIEGQVTVVGSDMIVETNEKGVFEIPGVELSAGILTLEIKAPGYPITWHTLPWSHRESEKTVILHMVEEDFFKETRESIARVVDDHTMGSLFGGADPRLFNRAGKCVYVSLEDDRGRVPVAAHGPFPLSQPEKAISSPLCLTHANPGFSYFNLTPGEYLLKWRSESGRLLRSHVLHIGVNRTSIAVN